MYNNSKKMSRIISINEISIIKIICYLSCEPTCYNYSRNTFICLRNVRYKAANILLILKILLLLLYTA